MEKVMPQMEDKIFVLARAKFQLPTSAENQMLLLQVLQSYILQVLFLRPTMILNQHIQLQKGCLEMQRVLRQQPFHELFIKREIISYKNEFLTEKPSLQFKLESPLLKFFSQQLFSLVLYTTEHCTGSCKATQTKGNSLQRIWQPIR